MAKIANESSIHECQTNQILIYATFPNMPTKKVKVNSSNPISVLFQYGNKTIFYQGEIIKHSNSFEKYGITNYDRIAIVPNQQISFNSEQFWRKSKKIDLEAKTELLSLNDSKMKFMISRKHDLIFFKIENDSKSYQKLICNMKFLIDESTKDENSTNLNWNRREFPNEASLPKVW
jgi:archaellum component FlaF (FlaF/FlaG flagellin family)